LRSTSLRLGSAEPYIPAAQVGLIRQLEVASLPFAALFRPEPRAGRLHLLLVADPSGNLPQAATEGEKLKAALESLPDVRLTPLFGSDASVERTLEALSDPTIGVLHYAGHAWFNTPQDSGLVLSDGRVRSTQLAGLTSMPRFAFVNACQSGAVRGEDHPDARAFAEFFLHAGVVAYVGTLWKVQDAAAAEFATAVYARLAEGSSIRDAVTAARATLLQGDTPRSDWANYVLYGAAESPLLA